MNLPNSAKEAAANVAAEAKKAHQTIYAYCHDRGVLTQTVYNWQTSDKGYNGVIYARLMGKPDKKKKNMYDK